MLLFYPHDAVQINTQLYAKLWLLMVLNEAYFSTFISMPESFFLKVSCMLVVTFDESCHSWVLHQRSVCCRPVWNSPSQSLCVPSRPSRGPCIMKLCVVLWFWVHIRRHLYVQLHMPGDAVLTTSYFQPRWGGLQPNEYTNKHSQQQFKKRDRCHGAGCLITEGKWVFFSESLMPGTSSCGFEGFFFFSPSFLKIFDANH